ncbi:MAG: prepilin peptidase [Lachnospiraceae bacterium]|nr:prepilin peptidase [Lachnospiraceae bacterium]
MKIFLARAAVFFTFYILSAYATTDILRLLKGSTRSINDSKCYCPVCKTAIALKDQIPIVSYFKNHGACRNCGSKIPAEDMFLELFLFGALSATAIFMRLCWNGFWACVGLYEFTKLAFLIFYGKRQNDFRKNLFMSLMNNLLLFGMLAFFFALAQLH